LILFIITTYPFIPSLAVLSARLEELPGILGHTLRGRGAGIPERGGPGQCLVWRISKGLARGMISCLLYRYNKM